KFLRGSCGEDRQAAPDKERHLRELCVAVCGGLRADGGTLRGGGRVHQGKGVRGLYSTCVVCGVPGWRLGVFRSDLGQRVYRQQKVRATSGRGILQGEPRSIHSFAYAVRLSVAVSVLSGHQSAILRRENRAGQNEAVFQLSGFDNRIREAQPGGAGNGGSPPDTTEWFA